MQIQRCRLTAHGTMFCDTCGSIINGNRNISRKQKDSPTPRNLEAMELSISKNKIVAVLLILASIVIICVIINMINKNIVTDNVRHRGRQLYGRFSLKERMIAFLIRATIIRVIGIIMMKKCRLAANRAGRVLSLFGRKWFCHIRSVDTEHIGTRNPYLFIYYIKYIYYLISIKPTIIW